MTTPSGSRFFYVGETVHLRVRVSEPGTRSPVDPATVVLASLRREPRQDVPVEERTFTRHAVGDYSLVLRTEGLQAGAHDVVITVADGPDRVAVVTDRFVLREVP